MTKKIVSQYDPGKPTAATQTGPNTWAIDSFRSGGSYLVTLGDHPSCTCRDFEIRGQERPCKHIVSVQQQAQFVAAAERAAKLTDAQLDFFLAHHQAKDSLIVAGAIRFERARRKQAQAEAASAHAACRPAGGYREEFAMAAMEASGMEAAGYDFLTRARIRKAAERPPIGHSVKIYGPGSESEAWATC